MCVISRHERTLAVTVDNVLFSLTPKKDFRGFFIEAL